MESLCYFCRTNYELEMVLLKIKNLPILAKFQIMIKQILFSITLLCSFASFADSTAVNVSPEPKEKVVINEKSVKNVFAKGATEGAKIQFSFPYKYNGLIDSAVVKYTTKVNSKRNKENQNWVISTPVAISQMGIDLEGLNGGDKYVFKIGYSSTGKINDALNNKENFVWSKKSKFTTERTWGVFKLLVLLGSLGIFIFGMKMMSDGLQKAAGNQMKGILSSMTSNRYKGVFSGFLMTSLVQSSSATTVMTVSFVNAGLLTLVESAGIMMGANVGTTITAWLVDLFGFKVSIAPYSLILIAFATPILFSKNNKTKAWGTAVIGFAILFMGLGFLKKAVPSLGADDPIVQFFLNYKDIPVISNLMFIALGTLVTVVVQSSSAAMALTMTLCAQGILPFEVACAMILGENIGTTITAEIASIIGNVHAKRSARIHSLFNIIGVGWMFIALPLFFIDLMQAMVIWMTGSDPMIDAAAATTGMAAFHTTFNVLNVVLLIWFVPWLVKVATKSVKSKGELDEEFSLEHIGAGVLPSTELSLMEAKKEAKKFADVTSRMNSFLKSLVNETDKKKFDELLKKIRKYEDITDRIEEEIAIYLTKIGQGSLTEDTSMRIRAMHKMISNLERIGDIYYRMSITLERKKESKVWFTQSQRDNLNKYLDLLEVTFIELKSNLEAEFGQVKLDKAVELERDNNKLQESLHQGHIVDLENGEYDFKSAMHYRDIFMACEKVGDHLINVSESMQLKI